MNERILVLSEERKVRLTPLSHIAPSHPRTVREQQTRAWLVFSNRPPQVISFASAILLLLQHAFMPIPLVLILVAIHRLAVVLRTRKYLPPDQRANWSMVSVVTTLALVLLPFYLAFAMALP